MRIRSRSARGWLCAGLLSIASWAVVTPGCTTKEPDPEEPAASAEAAKSDPAQFDLWAGVPPLEAQPDDIAAELTPRPGPPKPKSVSETIEVPFPPPEAPSEGTALTPPAGPLEVERFGPEGSQTLVDTIRVSFNESMVPLATVEALEAKEVPLSVDPPVDAKAKWLGTRTIALQTEGRIPYSTTYEVTVSDEVASIHGHKLTKPKTWSFTTPTLALASSYPSGSTVELDPTIALTFNQPIQRVAVLGSLKLVGGGKTIPLEEVKPATEPVGEAAIQQAARALSIRPKTKLRKNTAYTLSLPAGVFGEGPNKSAVLTHSFSTYPPLKVSRPPCPSPCWASNGISLSTTTSIADPKLSDHVKVSPEPDNLSISSGYKGIFIGGDFEGNATYVVEVDEDLLDSFGQTLGKTFRTSVKLGPIAPNLQLSHAQRTPLVIERGGSPKLQLRAGGIDEVTIRARAIEPKDLSTFMSGYWDYTWAWPEGRGKPSYEKVFDVAVSKKKSHNFDLPLTDMLTTEGTQGSIGWFIANTNEFELWGSKRRYGLSQLFEVTDLGIASALDHDSGVVAVHRLSTGEPVAGAAVSLTDGAGNAVWEGTTSADGIVEPTWSGSTNVIVAKTNDDVAYLPIDSATMSSGWRSSSAPSDRPLAFFFTERTPYKPGETIHLVGVLREEIAKSQGGVTKWRTNTKANYTVTNPRGIEVAKGDVEVNALGVLTLDIETKEEHGTGNFGVNIVMPSFFGSDRSFYHLVPVETFRTPEFKVEVERPTSVPLIYGDTLTAEVIAEYLHGAPMVGAEVRYTLTRTDSGFTPPGELNRDFTFGAGGNPAYRRWGWWTPPSHSITAGAGKTDARGKLSLDHVVAAVDPPPAPKAEGEEEAKSKPEDDAPPSASTYALASTVTDENRQAISGSGSFVVHASEVYVGLRGEKMVLKEGERTGIEAVAVDLSGERVADTPIELQIVRRETERNAVEKDGRWTFEYETHDEPIAKCNLVSRGVPVRCEVDVPKAGTYVVRGSAKDAKGRLNRTELTLYAHGKDAVVWDQENKRVDLVPDRSEYEPGDTANILVRAPFDDADGVLVVAREGIARRIPLKIHGGTTAIEVQIDDAWAPGVTLSALVWRGRVEIEGAPPGQDLGMPAAASGTIELDVSRRDHRIDVAVEPSGEEIEPKGKLTVDISTQDANGKPVSAGVALMVVDEGVLSLMGYTTPDPLSFFIRKRPGGVWMNALQNHVLPRDVTKALESPEDAEKSEVLGLGRISGGSTREFEKKADRSPRKRAQKGSSGGMAPGAPPPPAPTMKSAVAMDEAEERDASADGFAFDPSSGMSQPVALRTVFASTAYFDGNLQTDENGKLQVTIDMPENLTTFRVMAVAIDQDEPDRFGSADAAVRVRKAVMLRPSLPRFANFGDSFEASVMVDNQTGADQKILVGTRGLNVTVGADDQKFVDVPSGQSKEVRFDFSTEAVGTMRVQFAAMSNAGRDATQLELPVHYPATAEAFADYGMTDDAVMRALEPPKDVLPAFGGLELSFSSTALSGLEDSVQYLVDYPYECAEQTSSRLLPIFVLGKVLDEFPIASIRDQASRELIARRGLEKLYAKQNYDGGFGYWRSDESWPYVSTWATFALLEGKRAGFTVDEDKLNSALSYVEQFVRNGYPSRWGYYYDWTTRAFGLWLLSREGRGKDLFDTVWTHRAKVPLYARAYLMSAAHTYGKTTQRDEVLEQIRDAVIESPKAIHFSESRSEAEAADGLRVLMHSDVQTDAVVLMALLEAAPTDPMLPKVMAGIMAARDPTRGGRWGSTHTNAWALLSASRYYDVVEKDEPDFEARTWLGDAFAGSFKFEGRSMTKQQQTIPMKALLESAAEQLTVSKDGPGKLYYRLGMRYAPADLKLDARDQGFTVSRTYTAQPDPATGEVDPEAVQQLDDGSWVVKAGTNLVVALNVVVRDRTHYVVVDDALPAGFEGLNPKFVTSGAATASTTVSRGGGGRRGWWYPWWTFNHSDLRDDRMLLFADQLPAGVYTYSYTARATTIGEFILPPIKAEAMYEPERFGHSSSSRVRVVQ